MTTNFDNSLEKTGNFEKGSFRKLKKQFTNYYPWQRFYELSTEENLIKIWHINGDSEYKNSIKLTISDYSGCVTYYKRFNPLMKNSRYFKDPTWVNEIMEKSIVIVGLGLSESETFIRHVLINRHLYSKQKGLRHKDYYLFNTCEIAGLDEKKKFFLDNLGISSIGYSDYGSIYDQK